MQDTGLILCIHGEVNDPDIDIFDRESVFIDRHLKPIIKSFPRLKIVLEHITTKKGAEFIKEQNYNIGATITAHHLYLNRNHLFKDNKLYSHHYCLPVVKNEEDRLALIDAATSGDKHFFLGTDSAPHTLKSKMSIGSPGGLYTGYNSIGLYTEIFEKNNSLDRLEGFSSIYGSDFYGIPRNDKMIELVKGDWLVPESFEFKDDVVVPFRAGEIIKWKINQ